MPPFNAMGVQQQLRRLVINRAVNARAYSSYFPTVDNNYVLLNPMPLSIAQFPHHRDMRFFHTSQSTRTKRDSSTIDFAYMPPIDLDSPQESEIIRVPILPDNSTAPARSNEALEYVVRPEIATVSANGTHIDSPSAMYEVVDNHAIELSPFDLTNKVTTAATEAASKVTGISAERLKEPGVVKELWNGLLDDMLGGKKVADA